MNLADVINSLRSHGCSVELIGQVAADLAPLTQRSSNAERQARYRARLDIDQREWMELREQVFARDEFVCVYCGEKTDNPHCDHIIPLIKGGLSTLDNLATSCPPCNCGKSGRDAEEWRGMQ
jgi:5-methylcytosine-specific restriction endonuclease McrA